MYRPDKPLCLPINFILTRTFQTIKKSRCYLAGGKVLTWCTHISRCISCGLEHTVVTFVKVVTQQICHLALYHKSWCTRQVDHPKVGRYYTHSIFISSDHHFSFSSWASGGSDLTIPRKKNTIETIKLKKTFIFLTFENKVAQVVG